MTKTQNYKANPPFPLSGADNLRELGGYPTLSGEITRGGRVLRSDGLHSLTQEDKTLLYNYGVRQVIDLRSKQEKEKQPYNFFEYPDVKLLHLPIFVDVTELDGSIKSPDTLIELYIAILEGAKTNIASCVKAITNLNHGCTLFHCAAGKDRTGLVAMLMLMICGVPQEIVVADYCASCDNMSQKFSRQKLVMYVEGKLVNQALFQSSARDIVPVMEYLLNKYGTAEEYLLAAGCTKQDIKKAKSVLLA